MRLFKVLTAGGTGAHSSYEWPLPQNGKPGAWTPYLKGHLIVCSYGYHLCREQDLIHFLDAGPVIYEAGAYRDRVVLTDNDKVVVRKARLVRRLHTWNDRTARLFAADCAENVLPIFEKKSPNDDRPRKAIEAARAFARGEIDRNQLAAAWAAAWAAASAAAWAAAGAAARERQTQILMAYLYPEGAENES